ncbi:MAG: thioredoxin family protein [Trueperaceae bacterium]
MTLIEDIARGMDVDVTVAKVEDMAEIMSYGVLSTPGAVIDGTLVHSGGRPSRDKIAGWLGA